MTAGHEHTKCREMLGRFSDYIDGDLEAALCAELEAHLEGCADCQVVIDTMRRTITLYRDQATTELPAAVAERLYQALDLTD